MSATTWPFIEINERGRPTIPSKRLKVLMLVREHLAYEWDAEQLHLQYPHLSLPEIHAALGYYYEHRADCDRMIQEDDERVEVLKSQLVNPALQERLRLLSQERV